MPARLPPALGESPPHNSPSHRQSVAPNTSVTANASTSRS